MNEPRSSRLFGRVTFPVSDRPLLVEARTLTGDFNPHDHDFVETVLITGGAGFHCTRAADIPLEPGDVVLLAPGHWHSYRVPSALSVYNCCFGLSLLSHELTAAYSNDNLARLLSTGADSLESKGAIVIRLEPAAFARCHRYLRRITGIAESEGASQRFAEQMAYLLLYLAEISRGFGADADSAGRSATRTHPAVLQCRTLLTEQYARDWTLAELAEEIHIAPHYLIRLFRESAGATPMAYLARLRAERASLLLVDSDLPVAEIGARVGWPDANYFARRFRTLFGMTATEYRARFARGAGGIG